MESGMSSITTGLRALNNQGLSLPYHERQTMPKHDDGSISGIESFYTEDREDDRDWEDERQMRIEQESPTSQEFCLLLFDPQQVCVDDLLTIAFKDDISLEDLPKDEVERALFALSGSHPADTGLLVTEAEGFYWYTTQVPTYGCSTTYTMMALNHLKAQAFDDQWSGVRTAFFKVDHDDGLLERAQF